MQISTANFTATRLGRGNGGRRESCEKSPSYAISRSFYNMPMTIKLHFSSSLCVSDPFCCVVFMALCSNIGNYLGDWMFVRCTPYTYLFSGGAHAEQQGCSMEDMVMAIVAYLNPWPYSCEIELL